MNCLRGSQPIYIWESKRIAADVVRNVTYMLQWGRELHSATLKPEIYDDLKEFYIQQCTG